MKRLFFPVLLISLVLSGCSNHPSGVYVCEQSGQTFINTDSTDKKAAGNLNCVIGDLTFTEKSIVKYTLGDRALVSSYKKNGDMITVKGESGDLNLMIKDDQTLISEGAVRGTYRKIDAAATPAPANVRLLYIGTSFFFLLFALIIYRWRQNWILRKRNAELETSIKEKGKAEDDMYTA